MPGLAAVVPTLVVAGAVDVALPTAVVAAAVLGAVAVVGVPFVVLGAVVAGAALVVLAAGTGSCRCSCSRPP